MSGYPATARKVFPRVPLSELHYQENRESLKAACVRIRLVGKEIPQTASSKCSHGHARAQPCHTLAAAAVQANTEQCACGVGRQGQSLHRTMIGRGSLAFASRADGTVGKLSASVSHPIDLMRRSLHGSLGRAGILNPRSGFSPHL